MNEVREYLNLRGRSPFSRWFARLDATAAARVTSALYRLEQGHHAATKGVGGGVFEYRIHAGPGYRIYFGRDGERLIILVAGGTKRRQSSDIATAQERWLDYKRRKQERER